MNSTSNAAPKCAYCGSFPHPGVCPTVKAIEYHQDGTVKRVEFKTPADYPPLRGTGPWPVTCAAVPAAPARSTGSAFPSLCDSGGELWDADEAS